MIRRRIRRKNCSLYLTRFCILVFQIDCLNIILLVFYENDYFNLTVYWFKFHYMPSMMLIHTIHTVKPQLQSVIEYFLKM